MSSLAALPSAVCSGIAYAVVGLMYKSAERHQCRPQAFIIAFMLTGGITTLIATCFDATTWGNPHLWIAGAYWGIATYITIRLITHANSLGPSTISWTMLNLSLIFPILLAPILFHDRFLATDIVLVIAFVLMLVAFARSMDHHDQAKINNKAVYLLTVVGILLLDGTTVLGSKYKDIWFGNTNNAALPAITFFTGLLCGYLVNRGTTRSAPLQPIEWYVGGSAGLACGAGAICLLGATHLQPIVYLPIVKGLALAGGVLLSVTIYRERMNPARYLGLSLSLVVLTMAIVHKALAP